MIAEGQAPFFRAISYKTRVIPMQTPREILSDVWTSAGGDPAALDAVTLSASEPQLPSSFRVAAAAQVSIAASGLAATRDLEERIGPAQDVSVDMRHAVVECRSRALSAGR